MSSSTMTPPGNKVTGDYIEEVMTTVRSKNPAEPEFHQAVQEVFESLRLMLQKHPEYRATRISHPQWVCKACGALVQGQVPEAETMKPEGHDSAS